MLMVELRYECQGENILVSSAFSYHAQSRPPDFLSVLHVPYPTTIRQSA